MKDEKTNYLKIILTVVAVTGVISVALIAPNAVQLFSSFFKKKKYDTQYHIHKKISRLVEKGYLAFEKGKNKTRVVLTNKGKLFLEYEKIKSKPRVRWDGKWRIVMFDVYENNRRKRNLLRAEIKQYGFIQLQQSVWIYPYNCEDFIQLLKSDLSFGKNVRYVIADSVDGDSQLRKVFKLKNK